MKQHGTGVNLKSSGGITTVLFRRAMLTMLIAELSGAVTAVIDSMLTGRFLGGVALAAFGLGGPYFSVASIVSGVLMVGSTDRCTRAIGRGDIKALNGVFSLTIGLGVFLSVLLGVFGTAFSGGVAVLFGAGGAAPEVFSEVSAYLRGMFIGTPGFILFVILTPLIQLDGDSVRPKVAGIVCGVVDVVGDLLNVFVFHGGMFGMAIASTVSHYAALAVVLTHFIGKDSMFRFSLGLLKLKEIPALLRDGLPRALCMLCRALLPILLNALVLRIIGDRGVTALSARTGISFVLGAPGWGIGGAVLIMGGMMAGEQNVTGLKDVLKSSLKYILTLVVCFAVLAFLVSPYIAALYIPEAGPVQNMATTAIRCYAVGLPLLAFNVAAANWFQTVSRRTASNLINVGIEALFPVAAAYLLSAFFGISGVWLSFPVGQALLTLLIAALFVFRKDRSLSGLDAHLQMKPGFGVPKEDLIERSVRSMEEVAQLSLEVFGFCKAHGFDRKTANRLALCVEELAGNVMEHGFCDGKPHHLDLRILVKDGSITLRMRDDCALFDLKRAAENWAPDPEHPERNIGIRLVLASARDIVYSGAMNTNNLIITV